MAQRQQHDAGFADAQRHHSEGPAKIAGIVSRVISDAEGQQGECLGAELQALCRGEQAADPLARVL